MEDYYDKVYILDTFIPWQVTVHIKEMGKSRKQKRIGGAVARPGPLDKQIAQDEVAHPTNRKKTRNERRDIDDKVSYRNYLHVLWLSWTKCRWEF